MISKDYYDLTDNPHTEVKLDILKKYLSAWTDIIVGQYRKHPDWKKWKTPYYIDCFAGRGKYHKNEVMNCSDGSPLIALSIAKEKQQDLKEKYGLEVKIKCVFIEKLKSSVKELREFCQPFSGVVDYEIINDDFNSVINRVVTETSSSPSFFFVDAGGIKELKKSSVETIVTKRGARDIMLNYIINGPRRIKGLAKSIFSGSYQGKDVLKDFKVIGTWKDFAGMEVYDQLNLDMKELMRQYVNNVLEANNKIVDPKERLETIAYDMKHPDKSDLIYYLLFSSRKDVAINIMKQIFKEAKRKDYSGQANLFPPDDSHFDI